MPSRHLTMPDGMPVPTLGQGTWRMGESVANQHGEAAALLHGIERGLTLVDTAEMYGDGATERFLGAALRGMRERVFLVSKVYPQNAGGVALVRACDASLARLGTDCLDLYLLHWRGRIPLAETVDGMRRLQRQGKIRSWGVSNFDHDDMLELEAAADGLHDCACNQVLYNLTRRGPEFDLLPLMQGRGMPLMAYSPLEQGRLSNKGLTAMAKRLGVTPHRLALAWVLHQPGVIAIPKAASRDHVDDNIAAALELAPSHCAELDTLFPAPERKVPLEML